MNIELLVQMMSSNNQETWSLVKVYFSKLSQKDKNELKKKVFELITEGGYPFYSSPLDYQFPSLLLFSINYTIFGKYFWIIIYFESFHPISFDFSNHNLSFDCPSISPNGYDNELTNQFILQLNHFLDEEFK